MLINLNDIVRVKLTPYGKEIVAREAEAIQKNFPNTHLEVSDFFPKEDEDGWSEYQLWLLMFRFGKYITVLAPTPFEMDIEVTDKPKEQ
jgi:hypothetical protein